MKLFGTFALIIAIEAVVPVVVLGQPQPIVSSEKFEQWMSEFSNWGRWGKDDEIGTLNLITAEKRVKAAQLISRGISVSLARVLEASESPHNNFPIKHEMHYTGLSPADDTFSADSFWIRHHGLAHSHLDALCHVFHDGRMYNGRDQALVTNDGCQALSIEGSSNGFFTRGVLIDIAWLKGVSYLEPGTPILPKDLDAWSSRTGIEVASGDVVLIRTGRWTRVDEKGPWNASESLPGLHASSVKWLKDRDVAAVGTDVGLDVFPSRVEGQSAPVHKLLIVAVGAHVFDNLDLAELSKEAQRQGRWEFLFTAAPLRVQGGSGSALNPIATF